MGSVISVLEYLVWPDLFINLIDPVVFTGKMASPLSTSLIALQSGGKPSLEGGHSGILRCTSRYNSKAIFKTN